MPFREVGSLADLVQQFREGIARLQQAESLQDVMNDSLGRGLLAGAVGLLMLALLLLSPGAPAEKSELDKKLQGEAAEVRGDVDGGCRRAAGGGGGATPGWGQAATSSLQHAAHHAFLASGLHPCTAPGKPPRRTPPPPARPRRRRQAQAAAPRVHPRRSRGAQHRGRPLADPVQPAQGQQVQGGQAGGVGWWLWKHWQLAWPAERWGLKPAAVSLQGVQCRCCRRRCCCCLLLPDGQPPTAMCPLPAFSPRQVYDVTSYFEHHPGGDAILTNAGGDCTEGFHGIQHPPTVYDLVEVRRAAAVASCLLS